MQIIDSDTFIKIIRGEYYQTETVYSKFYVPSDYSDDVHVYLKNVEVSGWIIIKEKFLYPYYIKVENTKFLNRIDFNEGTFEKGISFRDTYFLDRVYFSGGKFLWMHFAKCDFIDFLAMGGTGNPGDFGSVTLEDISAKSVGTFGGHFKSLSFQGKSAKYIGVYNTGTFINSLSFSNLLEDNIVTVSNISINQLYMSGRYGVKIQLNLEI